MTESLALLHTSPVHIATFNQLLAQVAPEQRVTHLVRKDLLDNARREGLTSAIVAEVQHAIYAAQGDGASVVLCTCSTIGAVAEEAGGLRVDRPMAEKAIASGSRIIVAATVQSTIEPTRDLILDAAKRANKQVALVETVVAGAFDQFEVGNLAGYAQMIADHLEQMADQGDVIVLAQASMAGAAALCDVSIPILSSPQLGLQAALNKL